MKVNAPFIVNGAFAYAYSLPCRRALSALPR